METITRRLLTALTLTFLACAPAFAQYSKPAVMAAQWDNVNALSWTGVNSGGIPALRFPNGGLLYGYTFEGQLKPGTAAQALWSLSVANMTTDPMVYYKILNGLQYDRGLPLILTQNLSAQPVQILPGSIIFFQMTANAGAPNHTAHTEAQATLYVNDDAVVEEWRGGDVWAVQVTQPAFVGGNPGVQLRERYQD